MQNGVQSASRQNASATNGASAPSSTRPSRPAAGQSTRSSNTAADDFQELDDLSEEDAKRWKAILM